MFGFHKHEWHKISSQHKEESQPYGRHGFVKTIYYYDVQCPKCGETKKEIYNYWIHKPENSFNQKNKCIVDHSSIIRMDGPWYK